MTESLSSLCRTLTSEGGYQLRDSVLASGVYWTDRAGQGRDTGHRVRKGHRYAGCLSVSQDHEEEEKSVVGGEVRRSRGAEGNQ